MTTVDTTEIHSGGEEFLDDEEFLEELFDTSEESMSVSDDSSDGESTKCLPKFLQKGYHSQIYYKTLEKGKYCKDCRDRHHEEGVHQVIVGSERGSTFPVQIEQVMCNALIDTGASRSCISEKFYKQLNLPPIQELFRTHVRSATGGSLSPLGTTQCTFHIGEKEFKFNFIVCKHLLRPVITGVDFLRHNHIFVGYSELGQCVLEHKHMELVHSISINEAPILKMTHTVCVPARSIAVLNTMCEVDSTYIGQICKTRLDHLVQNTHPNLITISAVHCMDTLVQTGIPLIVLNLGTNSIELLKDQVVGHLDNE